MRVAQADGKAATVHFGCEIKDSEHLHPIRRDRIFTVDEYEMANSYCGRPFSEQKLAHIWHIEVPEIQEKSNCPSKSQSANR